MRHSKEVTYKTAFILICLYGSVYADVNTEFNKMDTFNITWDSPSKDFSGSMPIGNGDIGLNVWVEQSGDVVFYIGKTDSWGDNARLLKVGKVRIDLTPNPFSGSSDFQQTLNLRQGTIEIEYGKEDSAVKLRVWADTNHPVVHINSQSQNPIEITVSIELWRTEPDELPSIEVSDVHLHRGQPGNKYAPTVVEPDTVLQNQHNRIGWYHHNKKSVGPELTMSIQGLSDYRMVDPLLHRTFGAVIKAVAGKQLDDLTLVTAKGKSHRFDIYILTKHPASPEEWLRAIDDKISAVEEISFEKRRQAHLNWWRDFWNRSWIYAKTNKPKAQNDALMVTRAYTLQRFITACAGRGAYPIKFNGSIFNVPYPDKPGDADYRRWGPGYWWQNTRLPYLSMCTAGDYDLMQPLFKMYADDVFELSKYRTRYYFGHDGAYFPECIYFWGACFSETYGWVPFEEREDKLQTSRWHKWEWVCGPELVCLMLDYYEHTGDETFLWEKIFPVAREVMAFFENYYKTGSDDKLVMHPSQAVETWWECTNPMPEVAGLRAMSRRLLMLPDRLLANEERMYWNAAREKLPELPTRQVGGVRMLAPAEKFAQKQNSENPELYAVFPFRQIAIEKPNIELGIEALKHRWDKGNFGWRQDDIFMAYLGLTDEAREYLVGRAHNVHKGSRFPAFWGPNYDWIPDQDHGGVLMKAFQSMLMQTDGKKIYLLPSWPKDWDVDFKLHAPYKTVIEGKVRDGEVKELKVTPKSRLSDVKICK